MRSGPRREGISDGAMLALIGARRRRSGCSCGCGAAWPARCSARGWPRLPAGAAARGPRPAAGPPRRPGRARGRRRRGVAARVRSAATRAGAAAGRRRRPRLAPGWPALARRPGPRWAGPATRRPLGPAAPRAAGRGSRPGARAAGRLALGRHRGRLLYAEERHALVAFGPPQSGKSAGLAVPALLEWEGPAVASSIKTDLLAATVAPPARARPGVRVRPVRARRASTPHTWSPLAGARHLGRRARGGVAAGRRRRARSARRRGRRLLGGRRRAATGAAAVRGRAHRRRHRGGRALGLRPGRPRARRGAGPAHRRGHATSSELERRPRRLRRASGRSRPRPTARAPRSRPPPRRCCAPTASAASSRSARTCEITADRLLDERGHAVPDRRRQGVQAAAADLPGAALARSSTAPTSAPRWPAAGSSCRCCCAWTRPATWRRCPTWPRSPRPRRATTSSSSRSSTTCPGPQPLRRARPRRSSTATGRGCCCPAWPTSRRCATSPGWSARRRRGS